MSKMHINDIHKIRNKHFHRGLEKPFKCTKCDSWFTTNAARNIHSKKHTVAEVFKCSLCPYVSTDYNKLRKHRLEICSLEKRKIECPSIERNSVVFKCTLCPYVTTDYNKLMKHKLEICSLQKRKIECPNIERISEELKSSLSSYVSTDYNKLRKHRLEICPPEKRKIECSNIERISEGLKSSLSSYVSTDYNKLRKHRLEICPPEKRKIECSNIERISKELKSSLSSYVSTDYNKLRKHRLEICSLEKHKIESPTIERISEEDDDYECSECDFKCSSESEIMKHSAIHQYPGDDIDRPGTNGSGNCKPIVKMESSSHEHTSIAEDTYDSKDWNKEIKLENIDIDHDTVSYSSANQINEYDNIQQDSNSLVLILPKIEHIDVSDVTDPKSLGLLLPKTECTDESEVIDSRDNNFDIAALHTKNKNKNHPIYIKTKHPTYATMITAAIRILYNDDDEDPSGSSRHAILKYILANYNVDVAKARLHIKRAMRRMLDANEIASVKGCFKLDTGKRSEPERPYRCSWCDKAYASNTHLINHMSIHWGETTPMQEVRHGFHM